MEPEAELVALTEAQKQEAIRTYTKVIDDLRVGQVFACRVNANFWDGVKYYFTGTDAGKAWVTWDSHHPLGGLGASGRSAKIATPNKVKRYKPNGKTPSYYVNAWRFSLKDPSNHRVDSPWMTKKELNKCP